MKYWANLCIELSCESKGGSKILSEGNLGNNDPMMML